jgi:hypothetical protein
VQELIKSQQGVKYPRLVLIAKQELAGEEIRNPVKDPVYDGNDNGIVKVLQENESKKN